MGDKRHDNFFNAPENMEANLARPVITIDDMRAELKKVNDKLTKILTLLDPSGNDPIPTLTINQDTGNTWLDGKEYAYNEHNKSWEHVNNA